MNTRFFWFFFSNKFGFTKNFVMKHIENYLDLVVYTFFGWLNYDIYLSDNDKTSPLMINCMLVYFYATWCPIQTLPIYSMGNTNAYNMLANIDWCFSYDEIACIWLSTHLKHKKESISFIGKKTCVCIDA